jgi:Transposase DDE domain group 1
VQATRSRPRFEVVADGQGICSHVGAALLSELSDRLGPTGELGRRANRGVRAGARDRGQVLRDLLVMLADGGNRVRDLAGPRQQPALLGEVCSTSTAWRVLVEEVGGDPRQVAALWSALARARERAWALGAAPQRPLLLDLDANLVDAHSDKQGAAPTYKHGFGFHRGRAPLPGVCHHQPDPAVLEARHRPAQPPLLRLRRQRRLAHPGHDRPDAGLLGADPTAATCWRVSGLPAGLATRHRPPVTSPHGQAGSRRAWRTRRCAGHSHCCQANPSHTKPATTSRPHPPP